MRDPPPPRRAPLRAIEGLARGAWSLTSSLIGRLRASLGDESQLLFALTVVIGVLCGLAAVAFHLAIDLAQRLRPPDEPPRARHQPVDAGRALTSTRVGSLSLGR